jgi:hypothetical protein
MRKNNRPPYFYIAFSLLACLIPLKSTPQTSDSLTKKSYIAFGTGIVIDNFESFDIKFGLKYERQIKKNWYYSILDEYMNPILAGSDISYSSAIYSNLLYLNGIYRIKLWKDKLYWQFGLGIGLLYLNWEDQNRIGPIITASINLNIKLFKRLWLEIPPLIIIPPIDRGYIIPYALKKYHDCYAAMDWVPLGFKVMLK